MVRSPLLKTVGNRVEDSFLVGAPRRSDEQGFGAVPGDPVNDYFRGKELDAVDDKVCIVI